MISKENIQQLAQERIDELDKGLFIVDISISTSNVIKIEIDSEIGGVAIVDCMSVSRNVEHNLDREENDFELSVTSPGIDKPLRMIKQYIKNIGRDVKIKRTDDSKLEGLLKAANDEGIVVETTRKERIEGRKKKETIIEEHPLKYDEIKETKIVISFK
ncbi:MAG: ribosome assembly cofactor RimP [Lishizhenia sp.]